MSTRIEGGNNDKSTIMKWFNNEIEDGENTILVYHDLETFRQIYAQYVKDQLVTAKKEGGNEDEEEQDFRRTEQSLPRIILIAAFYETVDSVKHHLSAFGVENVQRHIDDGSLVIVDSFNSYFPNVNGMNKLVDSLSDRARKEGRPGVTVIRDMGSFFLYGGDGMATQLLKHEETSPPKIENSNVRGFSCFHAGNYNTLKENEKEELTQGRKKKLLEITG